MRALELAMSSPWAMLPERVEELVAIAARENEVTPEALEAYRSARHDQAERMSIRDNVAILPVAGPLFKKANLFVAFSGATSYEMLRRDLQVALDDPNVNAIMLRVDSPGGEAHGCDELAVAIYEARGKKPITAYVSGLACSGAYWIASAADKIVVSDLSTLGSIGVVLGITDRKKAEERAGISRLEFVSSQSPGKRPDLETDEGKRRVQKMVDDLATVFVAAVAKHRKVSAETVVEKFGNGGVEIGANAVAAGMADEVGQFETALAALAQRARRAAASKVRQVTALPSPLLRNPLAISVSEASASDDRVAVEQFRQRYREISALEGTASAPALLAFLRDETDLPVSDVSRILQAAKEDVLSGGALTLAERERALDIQKMNAGALGTESWAIRPDGAIDIGSDFGGSYQASGWRRAVDFVNAQVNDVI